MEKLANVTLEDIITRFKNHNRKHNLEYGASSSKIIDKVISAVVVYKESNFKNQYSEQARSYRVTNLSGKAFFDTFSGSRSIVGDALDGTDPLVRLDKYEWEIERCYFE